MEDRSSVNTSSVPDDDLQNHLVSYLNVALNVYPNQGDRTRIMDVKTIRAMRDGVPNQRIDPKIQKQVGDAMMGYLEERRNAIVSLIENLKTPVMDHPDDIKKIMNVLANDFAKRLDDPRLNLSDEMKEDLINSLVHNAIFTLKAKYAGKGLDTKDVDVVDKPETYKACAQLINLRKPILANLNKSNEELQEAILHKGFKGGDARSSAYNALLTLQKVTEQKNTKSYLQNNIQYALGDIKKSPYYEATGPKADSYIKQSLEKVMQDLKDSKHKDKNFLIKTLQEKTEQTLGIVLEEPGKKLKETPPSPEQKRSSAAHVFGTLKKAAKGKYETWRASKIEDEKLEGQDEQKRGSAKLSRNESVDLPGKNLNTIEMEKNREANKAKDYETKEFYDLHAQFKPSGETMPEKKSSSDVSENVKSSSYDEKQKLAEEVKAFHQKRNEEGNRIHQEWLAKQEQLLPQQERRADQQVQRTKVRRAAAIMNLERMRNLSKTSELANKSVIPLKQEGKSMSVEEYEKLREAQKQKAIQEAQRLSQSKNIGGTTSTRVDISKPAEQEQASDKKKQQQVEEYKPRRP